MTDDRSGGSRSLPWSMLPHRILRWWGGHVGFRERRKLLFTVSLLVVPFVVVGGAALLEGRFFLGSVTREAEGGTLTGMSFLGDPMVWPFMLLIPLTVVALHAAVRRVRRFLAGDLDRCLRPEWVAEHAEEVEGLRRDARYALQGRGGWALVYWAALVLGGAMFLFNLLTCTVPSLNPYSTWCEAAGCEQQLPKWDTDVGGAPLSWTAARIWVLLLGYIWIPLILARLLNVVVSVSRLLSRLGATGRPFHVRPQHPDGACGLAPISNVTLSFVYPLLFLALMVAMQFFKEGASPSLHNYAIGVVFIPLFVLAFFLPLRSVHKAMKRVRDYALGKVFASYERVSADFMASVRSPEPDEVRIGRQGDALRGIREAADTLRAMPTWPFGLGTIRKLVVTALVTLAPLAAKLAGPLLKKLLEA